MSELRATILAALGTQDPMAELELWTRLVDEVPAWLAASRYCLGRWADLMAERDGYAIPTQEVLNYALVECAAEHGAPKQRHTERAVLYLYPDGAWLVFERALYETGQGGRASPELWRQLEAVPEELNSAPPPGPEWDHEGKHAEERPGAARTRRRVAAMPPGAARDRLMALLAEVGSANEAPADDRLCGSEVRVGAVLEVTPAAPMEDVDAELSRLGIDTGPAVAKVLAAVHAHEAMVEVSCDCGAHAIMPRTRWLDERPGICHNGCPSEGHGARAIPCERPSWATESADGPNVGACTRCGHEALDHVTGGTAARCLSPVCFCEGFSRAEWVCKDCGTSTPSDGPCPGCKGERMAPACEGGCGQPATRRFKSASPKTAAMRVCAACAALPAVKCGRRATEALEDR